MKAAQAEEEARRRREEEKTRREAAKKAAEEERKKKEEDGFNLIPFNFSQISYWCAQDLSYFHSFHSRTEEGNNY